MNRERRGPRISAFMVSVSVALALHAAAFFAMRNLSASRRAGPAAPPAFVDVSMLLLREFAETARELPPDTSTPTNGSTSAERQGGARATAGAVAHLEWPSTRSGDEAEPTGENAEHSESGTESKPRAETGPTLSLNQLGIGGQNPFLGDRPRPGDAGTAESRLNDSLRAEIADSDVAAGLTRGGPVISALRLATFEIATPNNGTAGFMATTDATGLVVTLEPTNVSSHFSAWQKVADHALVQLKGKRLRIPEGSKGLTVRLEIVSRIQLPSGRDPGLAVSALGIPIKKGDGKQSTRIDILKPGIDLKSVEAPSASSEEPQKLPMLRLGVNLFGLDADPVDIAAKAQRIVRVRVVNERPL
jgi:hypothetical protein